MLVLSQMAIQINNALLDELGLSSLPEDEKSKFRAHIYQTLELRVGTVLADQMSEAQLDEFEKFIDQDDRSSALKWLETNFPDYPKVVEQEFEKLKLEIKRDAPKILESN